MSLAPRPESDSLAVIAKVGDHQAQFLVVTADDEWSLRIWIGFEGITIYDSESSRLPPPSNCVKEVTAAPIRVDK